LVAARPELHPPPRRREQPLDVIVVAPAKTDIMAVLLSLAARGLSIERYHQPEAIAAAVVGGRPDVAIVDLRGGDSLADRMLTWLSRNASCASLVITDADGVDARLRALHLGASDHLVAPFDEREAVARVQVLIGRKRSAHRTRIEAGDLTIDAAQRCVIRGGETVPLTPREVDLLVALVENRDHPLSKRDLLDTVWRDEVRSENVVEANISSLRRKLHALGPPVIHTVHRTGYVFRPASPTPATTRAALVAERDRLLRERNEVVARRDQLLERARAERHHGTDHRDPA
jgi:two-component system, OmpR family, response regulator